MQAVIAPGEMSAKSNSGEIIDVPESSIEFSKLPEPPPGKVIDRIDVVVRIRDANEGGRRRVAVAATPAIHNHD